MLQAAIHSTVQVMNISVGHTAKVAVIIFYQPFTRINHIAIAIWYNDNKSVLHKFNYAGACECSYLLSSNIATLYGLHYFGFGLVKGAHIR